MATLSAVIEIREEPLSDLRPHVKVPSVFESSTVLDVRENAEGLELRERQLTRPYRRDYDAVEDPMDWPARFDMTNWTLFAAFQGGERVGGALLAFDPPGVEMLEGRRDLSVLWDIRVARMVHRRGVGSALFYAVESWALERRCGELMVETQNTNVAACRFYERHGCHIARVNRHAYSKFPEEVQLIWSKPLAHNTRMQRARYG
jgi:GNAT superfamily N-acetyltransferase